MTYIEVEILGTPAEVLKVIEKTVTKVGNYVGPVATLRITTKNWVL